MPKLTDKAVKSLKSPGMYGDGEGLYLRVGPTQAKSWILRTVVYGKRRELGLGSASLVSLKEAREKSRELRKIAREGGDPDSFRNKKSLTFREAASRVHANLLPTWRSERHGEIWMATLERHVFPHFGARPIETVGSSDVLRALTPIWAEKHDTAKRVKQRIAAVFDWAKGAGFYPGENPVNGLKKALPQIKHRPEHMASLHWRELPDFLDELGSREAVSARALEFLILTAARSGEVRGARWSEIKGDVWEIPAERMKSGLPHRVPLSEAAQSILIELHGLDGGLIFPSAQRELGGLSRPMSDTVFKSLMARMNWKGFTTHGFRSTFRVWCSESARVEREVAEAALAHSVGTKVERAYARSDLFERRRELMEAWAQYATSQAGDADARVKAVVRAPLIEIGQKRTRQ